MKIVLTGGPSAGKTSAVEVLHRSHLDRITIVPEAASILFTGGFPRRQESEYVVCQQRAIFHVQKELEEIALKEAPGRAIICDRGSLDGLAYWPESEENFFKAIHSSMSREIARYDWIIHLDTASISHYQITNVRVENLSEALLINEKVKQAWGQHPNRIIIPNHSNFIEKLNRVTKIIDMILAECAPEEIKKKFS